MSLATLPDGLPDTNPTPELEMLGRSAKNFCDDGLLQDCDRMTRARGQLIDLLRGDLRAGYPDQEQSRDPNFVSDQDVDLADQELDWPAIACLSKLHDIEPLMFALLERRAIVIPEAWQAMLRSRHYQNVAANTWFFTKLAGVLDWFRDAKIPVLVLKGAALCGLIYKRDQARTLGDIDVLVPRQDAARAMRILQSHGYDIDVGNNEVVMSARCAGADPELVQGFCSQVTLVRQEAPHTVIDLHWSLVDRPAYQYRLNMDWFWAQSTTTEVDGLQIPCLSMEAQILHLSTHLGLHHQGHAGANLRWLWDIVLCTREAQVGLDWPLILDSARAHDLVAPLQYAMHEVNGIESVDRSFYEDLMATALSDYEGLYLQGMPNQKSEVSKIGDQLRYLPTWPMKWRYLRTKILPPRHYMRERYALEGPAGTFRLPWLYLSRPFRLVHQVLRRPSASKPRSQH